MNDADQREETPIPDDEDLGETWFQVDEARRSADSPAWGPLSARIARALGRFRFERMPPGHGFDDFVSEVFVRIVRDLPRFELRSRREFWGWVAKVSRNTLTDIWRKARVRPHEVDLLRKRDDDLGDPLAREPDQAAPSPSLRERTRELAEAEMRAIALLKREESRTVYLLRREQELPFEDIAKAIGRNKAEAARLIYFRAKKKVQEYLREELDGYATTFDQLS